MLNSAEVARIRNQKPTSKFIANNPSIQLVAKTIRQTAEEGVNEVSVREISRLFPYQAFKNKAEWLFQIFNWIDRNVSYQYDEPGKEQIKRPDRLVIKDRRGDCDDFTTLWMAILNRHGIRHSGELVKYDKAGPWAHVYVLVPTKQGPIITLDNVLREFDAKVSSVEKMNF